MRARVAVLLLGLAAGRAYAGDPAAEATELAGKGDFAGAAAKFREAYAADPRPELMCNVGVAYYKGNDYPHAYRYLDQCLAAGTSLDPAFLAAVRQVVAAVDTKLRAERFAPVDIAVEPATATATVELEGRVEEPVVGSRRLWIPWGHYKLTIHAEGMVDRVIEGDATTHDAIAARARLAPRPAGGDTPPPPPPDSHARAARPPPPPGAGASKVPAIAASVVAVAAGGLGAGAFVVARHRASEAGAQTERQAYDDKVAAAHTWQHLSWGAAGLGVVAAGVAGYLWYRAVAAPASVELAPVSGGAAASLTLRF